MQCRQKFSIAFCSAALSASRSAAWVTADNDGDVPSTLPKTAAHTYLRLRAEAYDDPTLKAWKIRCNEFERAFVFFKHEDGGAGPAYAARMMAI